MMSLHDISNLSQEDYDVMAYVIIFARRYHVVLEILF
jgi:hypothetical protein